LLSKVLILFCQPGVTLSIIPDPAHPDYSLYYVRDAAILNHAWLNRLITGTNDDNEDLRSQLDNAVLAFMRTQHIENPSGTLFTGGLDEPAFDLPLVQVTDATTHGFIGAPGGGTLPIVADLRQVDAAV
jgi:glucoamylase